ncbi:MAG: hypothetical protein OHK0013_32080 [Sandaracinaceae bacterium]
MPIHRVVVTSGTSALTGKNMFVTWARDTGLVRVDGASATCAVDDAMEALEQFRQKVGQLPVVSASELGSVSAECAIVQALHDEKRLAAEPDVAIVCSDTFAGQAAAELVKRVLERSVGACVKVRRTADLDAESHGAFVRSLGQMMADVLDELRVGDPGSTCFAPIGGYKVMAALGYVAGSVGGYPMAYTHERTRVLHIVPPIPVRLDPEVVRRHGGLFRSVAPPRGARALSTLSAEERAVVTSHPFFFEQTEDLVELSAFGVFALEQVDPGALRTRVLLAPDPAAALRGGRDGAFIAKELRSLTEELRDPGRHRSTLHHEADFGIRSATVALYKGASGKGGVFRCLYRHDTRDDTVYVFRIWLDHAAYEREAPRAITETYADELAREDATARVHA